MFKQHFKALEEYTRGFNLNKPNKPRAYEHVPNLFEKQLTSGLHVELRHLSKNLTGWTYRQSPVFIYGLKQDPSIAHISSSCLQLQNLNQWGWVSSDIHASHQPKLHWCQECINLLKHHPSGLNLQALENIEVNQKVFTNTVQHASFDYFQSKQLESWRPGEPKKTIKPAPMEADEELPVIQCDHCTWKLPADSRFLFRGDQFGHLTTQANLCLCCISDQGFDCISVPEPLRWTALQARYSAFNGICENWVHLGLHLDKTWHPLVHLLKQRGISLPTPYYPVYERPTRNLIATLAWPNKRQAIIPDLENKDSFPDDWNVMTYSEIMGSLK